MCHKIQLNQTNQYILFNFFYKLKLCIKNEQGYDFVVLLKNYTTVVGYSEAFFQHI